ncbi:MAG TPA: DUF2520 domain-containing protein [Acidimicrobiales bacterium]|nr:DUF2520 domain-containing protein [Acidimicrobiales bacterium]
MKVTIVGSGRAGQSFTIALGAAGHDVTLLHHDELGRVDGEVVLLAVPDDALAEVARALAPDASRVVVHVAGSRTLEVLAPHSRVASLHPLAALSSPERGAMRLRGATYCVAGDPVAFELVHSLGGRVITLEDSRRTLYHATATVAANHLVALMGQVERLASEAGLELEDFLALAGQALADVASDGPARALTGPASRGDVETIDAHLAAMPESERPTYVALAAAAFELAERRRSTLSA